MKFKFILIILFFSIISCSNDDEMNSTDIVQIEGIWKFNNNNTFYMTDGSIIEGSSPIVCGKQLTIKINTDNSIESIEQYTNNCLQTTQNYPYIKWEHLKNNQFKFYRKSTADQNILEILFTITFPSPNEMKLHNVAPGRYNSESYDAIDYNLIKL